MIIRRLADGFRNQDWFVVFIEVMIVFVGVFIGLQVDDWNEGRKDRLDEQVFQERLHDDILFAEELFGRLLERRFDRFEQLLSASDVLFGRSQREILNDNECAAIGYSHVIRINASDLSSLVELRSSGRMNIIQNVDLRTALVELQQIKEVLLAIVDQYYTGHFDLPVRHGDLFEMVSFFDENSNEISNHWQCDSENMPLNQTFLNAFSRNLDKYDAYLRDGLKPWISQFSEVHRLLDNDLGYAH